MILLDGLTWFFIGLFVGSWIVAIMQRVCQEASREMEQINQRLEQEKQCREFWQRVHERIRNGQNQEN